MRSLAMNQSFGIEICEWLAQSHSATPFIFLSGPSDVTAYAAAERLGAAYVFDKPFQVDDVCDVVSLLIGS